MKRACEKPPRRTCVRPERLRDDESLGGFGEFRCVTTPRKGRGELRDQPPPARGFVPALPAERSAQVQQLPRPVHAPAGSGFGAAGARYSSEISFGPNGHTFSKRAQSTKATQPSASQASDHSMGWRPGEFLSA
jgi:hypothetical protein